MNQSCKYTFRRSAAIGAAIAIVTASSAFGIGASAASAATDETAAPSTTATSAPQGTTAAGTAPTPPAAAEQAAPESSTPVTWAEPSSKDAPIVLTVTAGQPFSHTFTAQGGDGPLEYLFNPLNFDPTNDVNGWSWNEQTGVLSATPKSTFDGPALFQVTATDLHQTAVQYVQVDIEPGAPVGVTFGVDSSDSDVSWQVDADGTIRELSLIHI